MPKSKETISTSDSESGSASSEEETKRKSKPKKQEKKRKEASSDSASESEEDTKSKKRPKKTQDDKGLNKKAKKDSKSKESDESIWDIGGKKQVTVRNFKGKWFVDIREMYLDNNGEVKPGKKGICMSMDNWKAFMKIVEDVDLAVREKCN